MKSRAVAFCALLFAILCSSWSAVSLKAGNEINSTHFTATGLAATDKVKIEGRTTDKHPETTKQPISSQNNASKTTYETILTPAFAITCEMKNVSCAKCLEDSDWKICENQRSCAAKTGRFIPSGCKENGWYSKQCKIRGKSWRLKFAKFCSGILRVFDVKVSGINSSWPSSFNFSFHPSDWR